MLGAVDLGGAAFADRLANGVAGDGATDEGILCHGMGKAYLPGGADGKRKRSGPGRRIIRTCRTPPVVFPSAAGAARSSPWWHLPPWRLRQLATRRREHRARPAERKSPRCSTRGALVRLGRLVSTRRVPFIGSVAFVPGRRRFDHRHRRHCRSPTATSAFERRAPGVSAPATGSTTSSTRRGCRRSSSAGTRRSCRRRSRRRCATTRASSCSSRTAARPGTYQLMVRVRDLTNSQIGTATKDVTVPAFGPGSSRRRFSSTGSASRTSRRLARRSSSIPVAPSRTAATPCWSTSRATVSREPPRLPLRCATSATAW